MFEESLVSVSKSFSLLEASKVEFGNDLDVIKAKFSLLESNVYFILHEFVDSLAAATKGIQYCDIVKTADLQIVRVVTNTKRDLSNIQVRSQAKVQNVKAREVRKMNKASKELNEKYMAAQKLVYSQSVGPLIAGLHADKVLK